MEDRTENMHFIVIKTTPTDGVGPLHPSRFHRHGSREAAEREAERLAGENPGHEFIVYGAWTAFRKPNPMLVTRYDPEMPF